MTDNSLVLFTDFDGVFHHAFPLEGVLDHENKHFAFVALFEEVMRENNFPIVISSTWRNGRSLDTLRSVFSPDIAARIVGVTPFLGQGRGMREKEILLYLEKTGQTGTPWVALDDMGELFSKGAVVLCDDQFKEREAKMLREALQNPALYAEKHPIVHSDEIKIVRLKV